MKAVLPYLGVAAISAGLTMVACRHLAQASPPVQRSEEIIESEIRRSAGDSLDDEILREQTDRTRLFYGDEAFARIRNVLLLVSFIINHSSFLDDDETR